MNLIYYRGLNCHLASLINIANSLDLNYQEAYATLWPETDFVDETKYNIYVSKRVFTNLRALGLITEMLDCDDITNEGISRIPVGDMFLVGMDTFFIPWHPVFKNFHDPHYFFAQKESAHSLLCFDPVYSETYRAIKTDDVLSTAFELSHVYKIDICAPKSDLPQQAIEVLFRHPETEKRLLIEFHKCKESKNKINPLIKQVTAMINNRYLFRQFLRNCVPIHVCDEDFFGESFFLRWEAVKNGLYKASIMRDNKNIINNVCGMYSDLMKEEINIAKKIIALS